MTTLGSIRLWDVAGEASVSQFIQDNDIFKAQLGRDFQLGSELREQMLD